ncbi:transcription factor bHLH18-like [Chenopodium quinoa]|uniref:transcription factor bHLH18-like n=1 Tax=Chenopodium quinoa TaxID=63459 RepID=UPI000B772859|nr:transcription factor bHLH18-like [Chenopodium quinoa]
MTSTMTMDAWLAELEIDMDPVDSLIDPYHQSVMDMESTFDEQLAAAFFDTASPQVDIECNVIEQYISTPPISDISENHDDNNNNNNNNESENIVSSDVQESQPSKTKQKTKKQAVSTSHAPKRKRQPSQVQDHIIAERKRRELLSQMFISLSAILPGLKKIDKTSVLGEAIRHMKELQEKVKVLESEVAKRIVESVVLVNGTADDNVSSSSTMDDYCGNGSSSSSSDGDGSNNNNSSDSFSEIEVKVLGKTVLLRVYCEKRKEILAKLFAEVDKHHLVITNFSVIPFENVALTVTIVAQMEKGFNKNVRDFATTLRNALH